MGDRKARLAALAAKAGRTKKPEEAEDGGENDGQDAIDETKAQPVSFRNYAPTDDRLDRNGGKDAGESPTKRQRVESEKPASSASALQDALQQAKQEIASSSGQGKISSTEENLAAPKKINWDLKRDIQHKLNQLEKRTQKVIVEMLKERLEKEAAEQADSESSDLD
mmetsp:Transcript_3049/g.8715  ORF Transcript_3049/g.8715 Transcript_3049/m.8715 type:complete len:167 (-) Transcript_3049:78-578(-)